MQNFAYVRVASVTAALQAVREDGAQQTRFLAGGTTLVDLMRLDVLRAERLLDITSIRELQTFNTAPIQAVSD
jgi:xanthine dehydrogenase YagS FAD-binding subunit